MYITNIKVQYNQETYVNNIKSTSRFTEHDKMDVFYLIIIIIITHCILKMQSNMPVISINVSAPAHFETLADIWTERGMELDKELMDFTN